MDTRRIVGRITNGSCLGKQRRTRQKRAERARERERESFFGIGTERTRWRPAEGTRDDCKIRSSRSLEGQFAVLARTVGGLRLLAPMRNEILCKDEMGGIRRELAQSGDDRDHVKAAVVRATNARGRKQE
ncbi:hypothetical protein LX36DRAFT_58775 [Colletotrichum falcatum]|nr:hypothetical protein LX36DRAFT_58775 [Colletotrichum falcatum]